MPLEAFQTILTLCERLTSSDFMVRHAQDPRVADWGGLAMNSLRLEKGIRLCGQDFTKDHSAVEAGLGPRAAAGAVSGGAP